jgi:hypothetical protein
MKLSLITYDNNGGSLFQSFNECPLIEIQMNYEFS